MAKLPIEMLGAEVLRRPASPIDEPDEELIRLIEDMFETMYDAEGIGLAGPQVGVSRRVVVVDVREPGTGPMALINPRIVRRSEATEKAEEGCLSMPGLAGVVERPSSVVVEGADRSGKKTLVEAEGLLARCLQHEIDHLDGILFIDHLSPMKRNMLLRKWKKAQR